MAPLAQTLRLRAPQPPENTPQILPSLRVSVPVPIQPRDQDDSHPLLRFFARGNGASTAGTGWGEDTSTPEGRHLAAIIVPSILGAAALIAFGYYTYRHFKRKNRTARDFFERCRNGLFYTFMLTIGLPVLLGVSLHSCIKERRDEKKQREVYKRAGTGQHARLSDANANVNSTIAATPAPAPAPVPSASYSTPMEMSSANVWAESDYAQDRVQEPPPAYGKS